MVSKAKNVAYIAAYTSLTAVLAQITIYLPFTPIPITLQTLAVVLSGILGGPLIGFASQITYLALIASGLPIAAGFKGGITALIGPTAGFLYGFPIAALTSGILAGNSTSRARIALSAIAGIFSVYPTGLLWLYLVYNIRENLLAIALLPYIPGDVAKAILAAETAYRIKKLQTQTR